jgi:hypothetical protein
MKTLLRLHECDENHTYVVVTIVPLSESSRVEESVGMARMIGARRETLTIMGPMQGLIYVFLPLSAVFLSLTLFFFRIGSDDPSLLGVCTTISAPRIFWTISLSGFASCLCYIGQASLVGDKY